jgi:hypothetical protein
MTLPPDPLVELLLEAPDAAADQLTAALGEATALAHLTADDQAAQLAVIAAWLAYQSLMTTSRDLIGDGLDQLAQAAIVLAGDALTRHLSS